MSRRAELIRAAIEAAIAELRVSLPGVVESVDIEKQTADVRPLILNKFVNDAGGATPEELPVLPTVPIAWPRAGGFFIHMPIRPGDTGLLVFTDYPIDQWRAKGGSIPVDPLDLRTHSLTSPVFYPGLHDSKNPVGAVNSTDMIMGQDGGSVMHVKPNGEIHIGSENAADFVALAQRVLDELDSIKTWADAHTHGYIPALAPAAAAVLTTPPLSSPVPPIPDPVPDPQSVAASVLKAD